jgi:hypothetical protein
VQLQLGLTRSSGAMSEMSLEGEIPKSKGGKKKGRGRKKRRREKKGGIGSGGPLGPDRL